MARPPSGLAILAGAWVALALLWQLVGSPPIAPSSNSWAPRMERALLLIGLGICVGWPLLRLSASREPSAWRASAMDWLVMAAMLQLVLWPMRLAAGWTVREAALLDAILLALAAVVGLILANSRGSDSAARRGGAMAACVAAGVTAWLLALWLRGG